MTQVPQPCRWETYTESGLSPNMQSIPLAMLWFRQFIALRPTLPRAILQDAEAPHDGEGNLSEKVARFTQNTRKYSKLWETSFSIRREKMGHFQRFDKTLNRQAAPNIMDRFGYPPSTLQQSSKPQYLWFLEGSILEPRLEF